MGKGMTRPAAPTCGGGDRRRRTRTTSDVVYKAFTGRSTRQLVSRLRSHSLTELTRPITPPTKNGHALPPIELRKSSQSVNPYYVWTCAGGTTRPIKARSASPAVGTSRPVLTVRRTGRPTPKSNYELFNCNNLNIRYWSWNYRGCWHQTCPPMDPRLGNLRACCLPWMWINQVAFLRDVGTAWPSTCPVSYEEVITEHEHHEHHPWTWYWGHGQLRMQERACKAKAPMGHRLGRHKAEPGPGVVGYISMRTGLTSQKIIIPATSANDRPTTIAQRSQISALVVREPRAPSAPWWLGCTGASSSIGTLVLGCAGASDTVGNLGSWMCGCLALVPRMCGLKKSVPVSDIQMLPSSVAW
ncbi:hypothetical protein GOBAR_AA12886 [Gossypium barbadense]|uniref:Uncharacterized protein n=1 Tax=Gossypium barbadense TaxID=3634 RepID=A0A2P5XWQ4_GOSBA|nr:hypothetical protein GOBAR_AA12886 [Gossypium barbadense]